MTIHTIATPAAFDAATASSRNTLVVISCFATWCGPCKVIAPKVTKFSEVYSTARFYQLDVDDLVDEAARLGVRAMPTFVLFKDGVKVDAVLGADAEKLEKAIQGGL